MNITLNNREESFEQSSLSISDLLKVKKFTFKLLVIKVNDKFIKKGQYDETIISDGDNVAVIHLISGG